MGTINARQRKDGTTVYTAQVRIMRDGVKASASATFDRRAAAEAWIKRKEREAKGDEGFTAMTRTSANGRTLGDAIDRYVAENERGMGRTKTQCLRTIKDYKISQISCEQIDASDITAFAQELIAGGGKPQTVHNYLSHLSSIFQIAQPARGMGLRATEMDAASKVCKRLGITGKSANRTRRPTFAELNTLMAHFAASSSRTRGIPMHVVTAFALYSTRRQEEITRLQWSDMEDGRILVRDMKHPGEKIGNDQWVELPPEAERVIRAMPKVGAMIFPFNHRTISARFTRACKILGIDDLHFHDLRHEGISRLFEMGRTIPQAASVSGHRSWASLQRYSHIRASGDKWANWEWLGIIYDQRR